MLRKDDLNIRKCLCCKKNRMLDKKKLCLSCKIYCNYDIVVRKHVDR